MEATDITDAVKELGSLKLPFETHRYSAFEASKMAFESRTIIPTGLPLIDKHLGGGELGELILVTGQEGVGKSSFGLWWAITAAKKGTRVLYISTEDSAHRIGARLVSMGADIDDRLARLVAAGVHKLSAEAEHRIADAQRRLESLPLWVSALHTCTPDEALREADRAASDGVQLIFVDYLNRLTSGQGETHIIIPGFVKDFEALSREHGFVPVVFQQLHPKRTPQDDYNKSTARLKDSRAVADMSRIGITLDREGDLLTAKMEKSTDGISSALQRFKKVGGTFKEVI